MNLYVLDTDILSLYQAGNAPVGQKIDEHPPGDLAVTIITVEEQLSSWYTLRRRVKGRLQTANVYQRFTDTVGFLAGLQILSFTASAIDKYEELLRMKLGVRANDLRIAAIALDASATIITRNLRDFRAVPGLSVEDWSA
jgi:tRNA(fMet)-specific endonuclease VapC